MRNTGLDVDEIAGLVLKNLLEAVAEFVTDVALQDVEDQLEADMNVSFRDAARRDRRDVRRQFCRPDILSRHALLVVDAVPVPARAAAAYRQDPIVIFDGTELNIVFVVFHGCS